MSKIRMGLVLEEGQKNMKFSVMSARSVLMQQIRRNMIYSLCGFKRLLVILTVR